MEFPARVDATKFGLCQTSKKPCYTETSILTTDNFKCGSEACIPLAVTSNPSTAKASVASLFAQSYGTWNWDSSNNNYSLQQPDADWNPLLCGLDAISPCANMPKVTNVAVTPVIGKLTSYSKLTFTSEVDINQRPLIGYSIVWGDEDTTSVSGLRISDKPLTTDPHVLYHMYDYWNIYSKFIAGKLPAGSTCSGTSCTLTPTIKIIDNWGKESAITNAPQITITQ
jgi:hypothetical protein